MSTALIVHRTGRKFFAGACFAFNQRWCVALGELLNERKRSKKGRRSSDHANLLTVKIFLSGLVATRSLQPFDLQFMDADRIC